MSRFNLNAVYLYVSFIFESEQGYEFYSASPARFHSGEGYKRIEHIELKCVEEHSVPVEYADYSRATGYVFESDEGSTWYNQYPTASYGQTSTAGDNIVHEPQGTLNKKTGEREYVEFVTVQSALGQIQSYLRRPTPTAEDHAIAVRKELLELVRSLGFDVYLVPLQDQRGNSWDFARIEVCKAGTKQHTFYLTGSSDYNEQEITEALSKIGLTLEDVLVVDKAPERQKKAETAFFLKEASITIEELKSINSALTL